MNNIQLAPVVPIKPVNPCDTLGCIGSFINNPAYTTGTAGAITSNIILDVARLLTFVTGSVAVLFIVIAAFKMLTSAGDQKKYEDGIKTVQYAVIGLVLSVLAYGIVAVLVTFLSKY
jgi:glucose uptake protein GlcU